MPRILIIWGNWGPYHYARFRAFHEFGKRAGMEVHGLELFPSSGIYEWTISPGHPAVHYLNVGNAETQFNLPLLITRLFPLLARLRCDVVFVPSYWHWSLFANIVSRLCGGRIVMMNESHAGTAQATGWKKSIKRRIVGSFHAGLVGGSAHTRHFSNLGLSPSVLFSGYDAVDNDYFIRRSDEVRQNAAAVRSRLKLPKDYFLSLGRMVPKKNLPNLIRAYALFREQDPAARHQLVFVGSGDEEEALRGLCREMELPVIDRTNTGSPEDDGAIVPAADPAVHFYGFRQIEQNPSFYALASAFVLPSLQEEWGLVVNEAMACSLPVIVSRTAGCATDLVSNGKNGYTFDPTSVPELTTALAQVAALPEKSSMGASSRQIIRNWGCERFALAAIQAATAAARRVV